LAPAERRQNAVRMVMENWKVELIDVKMQNVEFISPPADLVQHQHVVGDGIAHVTS
jgi:hypothetical protein